MKPERTMSDIFRRLRLPVDGIPPPEQPPPTSEGHWLEHDHESDNDK